MPQVNYEVLPDSKDELLALLALQLEEVPETTNRGLVDHIVGKLLTMGGGLPVSTPVFPRLYQNTYASGNHTYFPNLGRWTQNLPDLFSAVPTVAKGYVVNANVVVAITVEVEGTTLTVSFSRLSSSYGSGVVATAQHTYTVPAGALPFLCTDITASASRQGEFTFGYVVADSAAGTVDISFATDKINSETGMVATAPTLMAITQVTGVKNKLLNLKAMATADNDVAVSCIFGTVNGKVSHILYAYRFRYGDPSKVTTDLHVPTLTANNVMSFASSLDMSNFSDGGSNHRGLFVTASTVNDNVNLFCSFSTFDGSAATRTIAEFTIPNVASYGWYGKAPVTVQVALLSSTHFGILAYDAEEWMSSGSKNVVAKILIIDATDPTAPVEVAGVNEFRRIDVDPNRDGGLPTIFSFVCSDGTSEANGGYLGIPDASRAYMRCMKVGIDGSRTPSQKLVIPFPKDVATKLREDTNHNMVRMVPWYSTPFVEVCRHTTQHGVTYLQPLLMVASNTSDSSYLHENGVVTTEFSQPFDTMVPTYLDTVSVVGDLPSSLADQKAGGAITSDSVRLSFEGEGSFMVDSVPVTLSKDTPVGTKILLTRFRDTARAARSASRSYVSQYATAVLEIDPETGLYGDFIGVVPVVDGVHPVLGGATQFLKLESGWKVTQLL